MSNSTGDNAALLPCPHCGSSNLHIGEGGFNHQRVMCLDCKADIRRRERAEVIAAWNTSQPVASNAALVEKIKQALMRAEPGTIEGARFINWIELAKAVLPFCQHAQPVTQPIFGAPGSPDIGAIYESSDEAALAKAMYDAHMNAADGEDMYLVMARAALAAIGRESGPVQGSVASESVV